MNELEKFAETEALKTVLIKDAGVGDWKTMPIKGMAYGGLGGAGAGALASVLRDLLQGEDVSGRRAILGAALGGAAGTAIPYAMDSAGDRPGPFSSEEHQLALMKRDKSRLEENRDFVTTLVPGLAKSFNERISNLNMLMENSAHASAVSKFIDNKLPIGVAIEKMGFGVGEIYLGLKFWKGKVPLSEYVGLRTLDESKLLDWVKTSEQGKVFGSVTPDAPSMTKGTYHPAVPGTPAQPGAKWYNDPTPATAGTPARQEWIAPTKASLKPPGGRWATFIRKLKSYNPFLKNTKMDAATAARDIEYAASKGIPVKFETRRAIERMGASSYLDKDGKVISRYKPTLMGKVLGAASTAYGVYTIGSTWKQLQNNSDDFDTLEKLQKDMRSPDDAIRNPAQDRYVQFKKDKGFDRYSAEDIETYNKLN
jgi:hypothetical protein